MRAELTKKRFLREQHESASQSAVTFAPHIETLHSCTTDRQQEDNAEDLDHHVAVNLTHATSLTPRGAATQHSPFDYLEANSFGGDTTLRVAQTPSPLLTFPQDETLVDLPINAILLLGEKLQYRTNASTSDDAGFDGDEDWMPSRVTFSEDVRVFEYETTEYESDSLETKGFGSCADSEQSSGLDYPEEEEDDNAVHAPADVAFIPLIPNRRLVTGGSSSTELRRYLAARSANRDPPELAADDTGGDTTRRNKPSALPLPVMFTSSETPRDSSSSGRVSGFHSCMSSMDGPSPCLSFSDALDGSELTTPSSGNKPVNDRGRVLRPCRFSVITP